MSYLKKLKQLFSKDEGKKFLAEFQSIYKIKPLKRFKYKRRVYVDDQDIGYC